MLCSARMLPSGLSWATFASLVLGVSCANDFVTAGNGTRSFPREFGLNKTTKIYWTNGQGYIAGIYVYTNGQSDDSADYDWVLGQSTRSTPSPTHSLPDTPTFKRGWQAYM